MSKLSDFSARIRGRLESLPLAALLVIGLFVVAGSGAGGYYAYRTYDYVQHDNEFCFSCHLMAEPFELFAESAHRGLGCKACHQPNIIDRSRMGLTAVIENPDEIRVHAEVPNQLCADCHIDGDPEKWTLIANSAGHRVHFESPDSTLQGLQCVECHSSSLHAFTAVDETCAQSGCHTENNIQLGAMSDLTIHCAACHGFSAPAEDFESASAAIAPDQGTCLSCHAMRILIDMPSDDPHEGVCASCHNPHEQATPAEAVQSCASSACHVDTQALTPFHEGLEEEVAADCLYCHQAHDFQVDGSNCVACHQNILDDNPAPVRQSALSPHSGAEAVRVVRAQTGRSPGSSALAAGLGAMHSWGYPLPQETPEFLHSQHRETACTECHSTTESHGAVTVSTVTDCRSCHHTGDNVAAEGACATCHADSGLAAESFALSRTFSLSTGGSVTRDLPFTHEPHDDLDCASCHAEGLELSAVDVDCASCHEDHHEPDTECMSCHVAKAGDPHVIETAHVTCSGSGCHQELPFEGLPRTRDVCLVCHQDQVDHRPTETCSECHAMPDAGG